MPPLSQREFDNLTERVRKLEALVSSRDSGIYAGPIPPGSPKLWQLWYTYGTPALKIWDGKVWVAV